MWLISLTNIHLALSVDVSGDFCAHTPRAINMICGSKGSDIYTFRQNQSHQTTGAQEEFLRTTKIVDVAPPTGRFR